jgi:hypothetical protein
MMNIRTKSGSNYYLSTIFFLDQISFDMSYISICSGLRTFWVFLKMTLKNSNAILNHISSNSLILDFMKYEIRLNTFLGQI